MIEFFVLADNEGATTNFFEIGLCHRRQWPEPLYAAFRARNGWVCGTLVNNREYQTDIAFESERLAIEHAAMLAYLICRNFSQSGGMFSLCYKGQPNGYPVQGRPTAVGTERGNCQLKTREGAGVATLRVGGLRGRVLRPSG